MRTAKLKVVLCDVKSFHGQFGVI